jgi:hypothetical protein
MVAELTSDVDQAGSATGDFAAAVHTRAARVAEHLWRSAQALCLGWCAASWGACNVEVTVMPLMVSEAGQQGKAVHALLEGQGTMAQQPFSRHAASWQCICMIVHDGGVPICKRPALLRPRAATGLGSRYLVLRCRTRCHPVRSCAQVAPTDARTTALHFTSVNALLPSPQTQSSGCSQARWLAI